MPANEPVWIALGSNLGGRVRYLALGRRAIAALPGVRLVGVSAVAETAPIGPSGQGPYLNQMVLARVTRDPLDLLDALQAVETGAAGRRRQVRWGPRTLDLDIVRFGRRCVTSERLTVPHPELAARPFWRAQLEELPADGL